MTHEDLIAAGYKKYISDDNTRIKMADCYYAKMLRDAKGKRFQIVFYYYDWGYTNSFQPEVQLRNDTFCVDISLHSKPDQTIKDVECYFIDQWIFHGRPYYELYEQERSNE